MIWKLIYELEHWIQIGIGGDIVTARSQRPEYQHLVEFYLDQRLPPEKIPAAVFIHLKKEAELPFYKSPTFWRLVWIRLRRLIKN